MHALNPFPKHVPMPLWILCAQGKLAYHTQQRLDSHSDTQPRVDLVQLRFELLNFGVLDTQQAKHSVSKRHRLNAKGVRRAQRAAHERWLRGSPPSRGRRES
eukprot:3641614-Pleurochrysis_carterae.AAC.1